MKPFHTFFKLEFYRLLVRRNFIIGLLFFGIAMYLVWNGIDSYREVLAEKDNFIEIEKQNAEKYNSIDQYGAFGINVMFIPSPLSVFNYNSGLFNCLTAHINVDEKLNITESYKGKDIFRERTVLFLDFLGFIFFFGSLILLSYGCETPRPTEYLKTLASVSNHREVFFFFYTSRFLLLSLFFILTAAAAVALTWIYGIPLDGNHYLLLLFLLLVWVLVALVFFTVGTIIGHIRNKTLGNTIIILVWIVSIQLIPAAITKIMKENSSDIPTNCQLDKAKLDEQHKFENRAEEKEGKFKQENASTKPVLELIESFWNNEYQNIRKIEKNLEKQMIERIVVYNTLTVSLPSTFFLNVNEGLSSKGFENIIGFFRYLQDLKHRFCLYYKENKFYSEGKTDGKAEPFIQNGKNIYYAQSRLPRYFAWGVLLLVFYCVLLVFVSYRLSRRSLYRLDRDQKKLQPGAPTGDGNSAPAVQINDLVLEHNRFNVVRIYGERFKDYIFNLFSGKKPVKKSKREPVLPLGKITVDGHGITAAPLPMDFQYLCPAQSLPGDIRVIDFLAVTLSLLRQPADLAEKLVKQLDLAGIKYQRFREAGNYKILELLLALTGLRKRDVYLFHDLTKEMPADAFILLKNKMEELTGQGALVLFLTRNNVLMDESAFNPREYFDYSDEWNLMAQQAERMKKGS